MGRSIIVGTALVSLFFLTQNAFCGKAEKIALKARALKAKVIACSPKGEVSDTISLAEALEKLKPKQELRLSPGDYGKTVVAIPLKEIVISGADPNKLCAINLTLTGENCVIRNVHLRETYFDNSITIVDSIIDKCYLKYSNNKKVFQVIDNCCFKYLYADPANKVITVLNSTFAKGKHGIEFGPMTKPNTNKPLKGSLTILNCLISGSGTPFVVHMGSSRKPLEFIMENSIYYGEWGSYTDFRKANGAQEKLWKALKKLRIAYKEKKKKRNFFVKPEFIEKDSFILTEDFAKKHKNPGAKFNKEGVLFSPKKR